MIQGERRNATAQSESKRLAKPSTALVFFFFFRLLSSGAGLDRFLFLFSSFCWSGAFVDCLLEASMRLIGAAGVEDGM